MKTSTLIKQNLKHYWRTNLAVIFGVGIAVAVLAGALLVGDSVRVSLKNLFLARLGNTDYLISSTNFFRDKLTDELKNDEHFSGAFKDICPVITLNGFVTHEKSGNRASGRVFPAYGTGCAANMQRSGTATPSKPMSPCCATGRKRMRSLPFTSISAEA